MTEPGAVVVLAGADEDRARARAMQAFRGGSITPEVFADGPLTVAYAPAPERDLYVSETTACLVEGRIYEMPAGARGRPASTSPAAQLAAAYERRGPAVLSELRGEFWALLWDRRQGQGLVMADQLGTHSPYWTHDGRTLVVASEVRELLASLSREPAPDPVVLAHWLLSTGPQPGTTLLKGVHSIRASHYLRLTQGSRNIERYWSPEYREPMTIPRAEQVDRLRDRLATAVHRRRGSGDATGVLLSGGLDSSTVAALARRDGRLRAYSAVFPDHPRMDESGLIDRTAAELGIDSSRIVVRGGSTIRGALEYIQAWKLPPTSPNLFFWTPLLERAASDGIEVMLDGEGGDELFAFSPYLVADRLRSGRLGSALNLARRWPGEQEPPSRDLLWLRLRQAGVMALMPPAAHRLSRRVRSLQSYAPAWLPPGLARQWLDSETSAFAWKQLPGPRWWAFVVELVTRGAGPSVVYEQSRRRSQLAGIAASHPLVDVDVIELALRLDPELSFDRRFNRSLLRDAMAGLLPDQVRLRRGKSSFDALFHQLLAGPELDAARKLLDPTSCELRAYIDMGAVYDDLLGGDPSSRTDGLMRWATRVWRLVTAECWLRSRESPVALDGLKQELELPITQPEFDVYNAGGRPANGSS